MLVSEVASQYYHLVGLDKKCVILKEEIQKAQESYELTNELMKEGEVSRLSVDQFQSRGLKLEEMLLDTRQQITEAERALALLLGKLPFEIKRSTFEEISESQFPVASGIPAQLLRNRPDVKLPNWNCWLVRRMLLLPVRLSSFLAYRGRGRVQCL